MKLITVIGARPQFVKAAAVSRAIALEGGIDETIVHTGQHYDKNMSDLFFEEMGIPEPKFHLNVGSGSHAKMTGAIMERIEATCLDVKPDAVMVYGDTNSTLAAALAAAKIHVPVIHIEAGLRSFNMRMPEEINRILTDRVSRLLFCPTQTAIDNLKREGFDSFGTEIQLSGDVMLDAALHYAPQAQSKSRILESMKLDRFALCTIHRAENTNDLSRLKEILAALGEIGTEQRVVLPLHPRTKTIIASEGLATPNLDIIDPVGYFDMLALIQGSSVILTDSGGLQKEAFFFKKACITLRDETEWSELVERQVNRLVGADRAAILGAYKEFLNRPISFDLSLYGNGEASKRIARRLAQGL